MKTLVKWFVKKYVSKDAIKTAIRSANKALREKVQVGDGKAKVIDVANDVAEVTASYLSVYADDGKMDEAEETKVNEACDKIVDKYIDDALVDSLIDKLFD